MFGAAMKQKVEDKKPLPQRSSKMDIPAAFGAKPETKAISPRPKPVEKKVEPPKPVVVEKPKPVLI